jgi:hypothetical protein
MIFKFWVSFRLHSHSEFYSNTHFSFSVSPKITFPPSSNSLFSQYRRKDNTKGETLRASLGAFTLVQTCNGQGIQERKARAREREREMPGRAGQREMLLSWQPRAPCRKTLRKMMLLPLLLLESPFWRRAKKQWA